MVRAPGMQAPPQPGAISRGRGVAQPRERPERPAPLLPAASSAAGGCGGSPPWAGIVSGMCASFQLGGLRRASGCGAAGYSPVPAAK